MLKKFIPLRIQWKLSLDLQNQVKAILAKCVANYLVNHQGLLDMKLCTGQRSQKYSSSANIVINLSQSRTCSNDMRSDTPGLTYTLVQTAQKCFTSLQGWRGTEKLTLNQRCFINVLSAVKFLLNSTNLCDMNIFTLERGHSPALSVAKDSLS